jgi:hypothetical protein
MKKIMIIVLFLISVVVLNSVTYAQDMIVDTETVTLETDIEAIGSEKVLTIDIEKYIEIGKNLEGSKSSKYYYPTKYFQNGQSWSSDNMETSDLTIGSAGCALTSFAMLASLYNSNDDPGDVNQTMGNYACPFYWTTAENYYNLPDLHYSAYSLSDSGAKLAIAGILEEEGVCIVGLEYTTGTHFVLARGYYQTSTTIGIRIYDPNSNKDYTYLQDYFDDGYSVYRLVYYSN